MIIAVVAVWMVQMSIHKIVNVVAVWHWFVSAAGAVNVTGIVPLAGMRRCTCGWIDISDLQHMFFDLTVGANVMHVTVVEVVDVVTVLNSGMLAIRTVLMGVVCVNVCHLKNSSFRGLFHCVHDPIGHQLRNMLVRRVHKKHVFLRGVNGYPLTLQQSQPL